MGRIVILLGLLLLQPNAARAAWLEASSAHFLVYANGMDGVIRRFSEQLERYHAAMVYVTDAKLEAPSPSNRVTVYVVGSSRDVRRLHGEGNRYVAGFYVARAGSSVAMIPHLNREDAFSQVILLHEYAHHFMHAASDFPTPPWLTEGSAEFMSTARFGKDGSVQLGLGAWHRAAELLYPGTVRNVTATQLLETTEVNFSGRRDAFYGRSWLLYHYLTFDQQRKGQLVQYMQLLTQGKSSVEAGREAFGDLDRLNDDLNDYLRARGTFLEVPAEKLETGPVTVRRLSAAEAAIMPVRIRSDRGVKPEQAEEILAEAKAVAARYPQDAMVLSALAEAQHDAGHDAEAVAAADAALAIDPTEANAHVQKGLALYRMAGEADGDDSAPAYARARAAFVDLNRVENNHPLPLIYNYRILVAQGEEPNELAVRGLERAAELAPFDLGLRMTLAMEQLRSGARDRARANLAPVAYNPHGGTLAQRAQETLERMESDPDWNGSGMVVPEDEDEDDDGYEDESVRRMRSMAAGRVAGQAR